MKHRFLHWNIVIAMVAAALLIASGFGCAAASPSVQVARQEQVFTLGVKAMSAGLESGQLDKAQFQRLRPLVIAVSAYLDEAKASAGQVTVLEALLAASVNPDQRADLQQQLDVARDGFTRTMRSLNAALAAFNTARQEAGNGSPHRDTVQPSAIARPGPSPGAIGWAAGSGRGRPGGWIYHAPAIAGA